MGREEKFNVLGVIPARLGSTRLERKALLDIGGKTLVQRVWEQARSAKKVSRVVVATDAPEIFSEVRKFGGDVVMTDSAIPSGSDRVAAVINGELGRNWDIVVNIQGDMPFINGVAIDRLVEFLGRNLSRFDMATIAVPLRELSDFSSQDRVKVVIGANESAIYFSRSPIPFSRDGNRLRWKEEEVLGFRHIGLYAYTPQGLDAFTNAAPSVLETIERLEQLRALEIGMKVGVCVVDGKLFDGFVEIDTAGDLEKARNSVS